jgi:hypothetical protein
MAPDHPAHSESLSTPRIHWPFAPLLVVFWGVVVWGAVACGFKPDRMLINSRFAEVESRIDPNEAPWFELTILPGIGEGKARGIVAHRMRRLPEETSVFREAADLDQVPGIGPVTIRRISRELRFPKKFD